MTERLRQEHGQEYEVPNDGYSMNSDFGPGDIPPQGYASPWSERSRLSSPFAGNSRESTPQQKGVVYDQYGKPYTNMPQTTGFQEELKKEQAFKGFIQDRVPDATDEELEGVWTNVHSSAIHKWADNVQKK